jgi:hypothetical protein
MNFEGFLFTIENVNSDIFLYILIFLYENRPFTKNTLDHYENAHKTTKEIIVTNNIFKMSKSPMISSVNKLIVSPNLFSKFSPCIAISKSPTIQKKFTPSPSINKKENDLLVKLGKAKPLPDSRNILLKYTSAVKNNQNNPAELKKPTNENINTDNTSKTNLPEDSKIVKNIPVNRKNRNYLKNIEELDKNKYFSNSVGSKKEIDVEDLPFNPVIKYRSEGKIGTTSGDLSSLINQLNISEEESEDEVNDVVQHEGYLYKITHSKKLKKLWFKLVHKDLYCNI